MNKLFNLIKPVLTDDLIRLGRKSDGGYVINKIAIQEVKLISLGISTDWTFEEDFLKLTNQNVIMYDGSISKKIFWSNFRNSILEMLSALFLINFLSNPKILISQLKIIKRYFNVYQKFKNFISINKVNFISEFVSNIPNTVNLSNIINKNIKKNENIFLKIDIEGHEYRIYEDIIENHSSINGLVIEFHDIDLMYFKFNEIIEKLGEYFYITHIHANNYSHYSKFLESLVVYEISFLNKKFIKEKPIYFKEGLYNKDGLDFSNNPLVEDYLIKF